MATLQDTDAVDPVTLPISGVFDFFTAYDSNTGQLVRLTLDTVRAALATTTPAVNQKPAILLQAIPSTGIVGQKLTLYSNATDADGYIKQVEFFLGNQSLGVVTTAPFSLDYTPTAAGMGAFTAIATDNSNATTPSDLLPVQIAAAPGVPGSIAIRATAGTGLQIALDNIFTPNPNGSPITGYDLFLAGNATPFATGVQLPYTYTASSAGSYTFQGRAVNAVGPGALSTNAGPITVPVASVATLTSIALTGPNSVSEGTSGTYVVVGTYSDSTTKPVTSGITWGSNTPGGVLTVHSNQTQGDSTTVTVTATVGTLTTNKVVAVADTTPGTPATLTSISLNGPASVNEGSSGTYTVTGSYSDGTSKTVTSGVTWGTNTPNGVLTVPSNQTQGDSTTATVTATVGNLTASKTVTVADTTPGPVTYTVTLDSGTQQPNSPYDGAFFAPASTQQLKFNGRSGTGSTGVTYNLTLVDSSDNSVSNLSINDDYKNDGFGFVRANSTIYTGTFPAGDATITC